MRCLCCIARGFSCRVCLFKRGLHGSTVMNFTTAACFVLAGLSLLALAGETSARWRWLGVGCALLVALAGFLTLAEYGLNWSVGINRLFIQPPPGESALHYRMAPQSAFGLLLVGLTLLLLYARRERHLSPRS